MAGVSPRFSTTILVVMLVLLFAFADVEARGRGKLRPTDCQPKCDFRCSATGHRKPFCMSFCLECCNSCLCVPPGTAGNKQMCPCYNNWKTKRGGPKCP